MSPDAVRVESLSKCFKLYGHPWHRFVEWGTGGRRVLHHPFWALRDVSLSLAPGRCLGIIGSNGAGKSTLLKILSGALYPTSGTYVVRGRLVSLLDLGIGFHPELTGIQNIFMSANLLGFSDGWVRSRMDAILAFAELGDFVHRPVKTYSSGMYVRLAFSVFAFLEPDVYIVDEALAVGDIFFQQKCFRRLAEMKEQGAAILLVSHDLGSVTLLCDEAILLSHGRVASEGDPKRVVHDYFALLRDSDYVAEPPAAAPPGVDADETEIPPGVLDALRRPLPAGEAHPGTRRAEIVGFAVTDEHSRPAAQVRVGEPLHVWVRARANEAVDDLHAGIHLYDHRDLLVFAVGTANRGLRLPRLEAGEEIACRFAVRLDVAPGDYTILPQLGGFRDGRPDPGVLYDRRERLQPISVVPLTADGVPPFYGIASLPASFAWMRLGETR